MVTWIGPLADPPFCESSPQPAAVPTASAQATSSTTSNLEAWLFSPKICSLLLRCGPNLDSPPEACRLKLSPSGIKGVAKPVSQKVEAQNGYGHRHTGEDGYPGSGSEVLSPLRDQVPPACGGRLDPDAQEGEYRLVEHGGREAQGNVHDYLAVDLRQKVPHQNHAPSDADTSRGLDVLPVLDG